MTDTERIVELEKRVRELEDDVESYKRLFRVFGDFTRRIGGALSADDARVRLQAAMEGRMVPVDPATPSPFPIIDMTEAMKRAGQSITFSDVVNRAIADGRLSEVEKKDLTERIGHFGMCGDTYHYIVRDKWLADAKTARKRGELGKARDLYREINALYPDQSSFMVLYADCAARLGDTIGACATYEKVAEIYTKQGFYLKAVSVMKQILKIEPQRIETMRALATLYAELGLTADAEIQCNAVVETLLETSHDGSLIKEMAKEIVGRGFEWIALPLLERCYEIAPHDFEVLNLLARTHERLGHTGKAIEAYEELQKCKIEGEGEVLTVDISIEFADKIAELKRS